MECMEEQCHSYQQYNMKTQNLPENDIQFMFFLYFLLGFVNVLFSFFSLLQLVVNVHVLYVRNKQL